MVPSSMICVETPRPIPLRHLSAKGRNALRLVTRTELSFPRYSWTEG